MTLNKKVLKKRANKVLEIIIDRAGVQCRVRAVPVPFYPMSLLNDSQYFLSDGAQDLEDGKWAPQKQFGIQSKLEFRWAIKNVMIAYICTAGVAQ